MAGENKQYDVVLVELASEDGFLPNNGLDRDGQLLLTNLNLLEHAVKCCNGTLYVSMSSGNASTSVRPIGSEGSIRSSLDFVPSVTRIYDEVWDFCLCSKKNNIKATVLFPDDGFSSAIDRIQTVEPDEILIINSGRHVDRNCLIAADLTDELREKSTLVSCESLLEIINSDHPKKGQKFSLYDTMKIIPKYDHVVLGGTFDRFHLGHRKLLSVSASVCAKRLVIGITSVEMLKGKKNSEQIEGFESRARYVKEFLKMMKPSLQVDIHEIFDPYGPSIVDPLLQAIVVSSETLKGGQMVNVKREQNNLNIVDCIAVLRSSNYTLSSTFLRNLESPKL